MKNNTFYHKSTIRGGRWEGEDTPQNRNYCKQNNISYMSVSFKTDIGTYYHILVVDNQDWK